MTRSTDGVERPFPRPGTRSEPTEALPVSAPRLARGSSRQVMPPSERTPDGALDLSRTRSIGRFELIRELARGGMGQVFLGRDTKLGRKVAIKFLLRDDPSFVQRFLVEARATARCTHENIVTIYEVGEHAGLPYMVLEYLEGKTLGDVIDARPPVRQFLEIMLAVARALERAHEHAIVHRDLKPGNVIVTDRGQVKVLDFGVARLLDRADSVQETVESRAFVDDELDSSATFARSNEVVGTLPYMSPEQWGAGPIDHQSDLWAFGMMFWRALARVHPAGTSAPDKLRARLCDLDTPLPSIGGAVPTLPADVISLVDRCVAKRPRDRYQSAAEIIADLTAHLAPRAELVREQDACPYRGLVAFGEDDARYFFGRANELRTAVAQLAAWPLLAVVGPSGAGKSSFVHAGLVPALRATGGRWRVEVLRPGRLPLQRLADVLANALATGESDTDLMFRVTEAPGAFGATLRAAAERRDEKIVLVIDQLEELFTLCDSEVVRGQFLAALFAAADDPSTPIRVVLSMRADFLDRFGPHRNLMIELSRGLMFLASPDANSLREAIMRPAQLAGFAFEDEWIVEDMMQAATSRSALPLLSFAATRLWDARDRERKLLTVAAYNEMGGVAGAFARHADQVAAAVAADDQPLLRAIMSRLVTTERTRAVVERAELCSLAEDSRRVDRVLDHLVRARLIHVHTEADQNTTVEIVHEMLIHEWPMLRRWLEDGQALRGFLDNVAQAARQWSARGRPTDLVWRGATAREAIGNDDRFVLSLSATERDFLAAVRRQLVRARRQRIAVVALIVTTLVTAFGLGAFALARVKHAEHVAREQATAAQHALAKAHVARDALQGKLDVIERERRAREEAERTRTAAEAKRRDAERAAEKARDAEQMSREQLEQANQALTRKVRELQIAKEAANQAEASARRAMNDAQRAKAAAERLSEKERAAKERLQRELRQIDNRDLIQKRVLP
jgi:hypothetical protein